MDFYTLQARDKDFKNTVFDRASSEKLAKLLATEDITVRYDDNIQTAGFDIQNRVLFLPVWKGISKYLNDMLLEHEMGHASFTPVQEWLNGIDQIAKAAYGTKDVSDEAKLVIKDYINIVEDVRIDRLQRIKFPGARKDYAYGFKELIVIRDLFDLKNMPVEGRTFVDRANIYFKGGRENLNIPFTPAEQAMLLKFDATTEFSEVLELAEELFLKDLKDISANPQKSKQSQQNKQGQQGKSQNGNGQGQQGQDQSRNDANLPKNGTGKPEDEFDTTGGKSGEGEDQSGEGEDQSGEGEGKSGEGEDQSGEGEDQSGEGEGQFGDSNQSGEEKEGDAKYSLERGKTMPAGINQGKSTGKGVIPVRPNSSTTLSNALENLAKNPSSGYQNTNIVYATIPEPIFKNIVDDYTVVLKQWKSTQAFKRIKNNVYDLWRKEDKDALNTMIREFEMRKSAEMLKRESVNKTGVLDVNRLYQYKFTDDVFRRNSTFPKGKNHGFVMIVDWSSSMSDNIDKTIKQMLSIALFCKRMNMPFEAYLFRDPIGRHDTHSQYNPDAFFNHNVGDMEFGAVKLRNILSSRMTGAEFKDAARVLLSYMEPGSSVGNTDPMTGTPLNSALVAVPKLLQKFKEETGVEIVNLVVLTDGDSNPSFCIRGFSGDFRRSSIGMNRNILQNKKTRRDYPMATFSSRGMTISLLKNIKDITNCNLIGIFITASGIDSTINYTLRNYVKAITTTKVDAYKKFANENGFIPIDSAGYDEYYFVFMKNYSTPRIDLSKKDAGLGDILKVKKMQRVMLRRFIEMVASGSGFGKKKAFDI